MPLTVSATAAPTSSGPTRLKIAAITIACSGVAPRVATSVAIAFDASCSPFVVEKASANTVAIASPGSIDGPMRGAPVRPRQRPVPTLAATVLRCRLACPGICASRHVVMARAQVTIR